MAGPTKRNSGSKAQNNPMNKDYVGKYDGSPKKWTTRRTTDSKGQLSKTTVPVKSKPQEAGKYPDKFNPASAGSRPKERTRVTTATKKNVAEKKKAKK